MKREGTEGNDNHPADYVVSILYNGIIIQMEKIRYITLYYVREGVFLTQTSVMVPGGSPPWRAVSRSGSEVGINPLPTPPELLRDSLYRSRTCDDRVCPAMS